MPRSRAHEALALLAALLVAGCAQPAATEAATASTPQVEIVDDRPGARFGDVATGPAVGPDLNATTAAPPQLVAGEWWRIAFSSREYDVYQAAEVVRVVAAVESEGYLFGMPHEGWYKESIAYHAPAFGDVGFDLSYAVHNERFEPLRFPLVAGATWETTFATQPLVATVESADEHTAVIRFEPKSDPQPTDPLYAALGLSGMGEMRLTYDARQHEVVKFESFIGMWEVVEHGYDFEGWVTIPRGEHTAIDHGQFLAATPGEPVLTRTQEIAGGYNRMTLMHAIAPLAPGAYRLRALAPDGTEFLTESLGDNKFTFRFYEATDPDGAWTLEDTVAGVGGTYSMGIAYHQYDIRLPDGARRSDHSHAVVR